MACPDLVLVGNLIVDDTVLPDGRTRFAEAGGAVLYAALGAGLWGVSTGVVSRRGDDYPEPALAALVSRGVDLAGVRPLGRSGMRTWLLYEGRRRRVVHHLEAASHEEGSPGPEEVPAAWRAARAFHLTPMPFEAQRRLVDDLAGRPGALVSVDPYVLLGPGTWEQWRALVNRVDVFFLSEDEMDVPGGLERPEPVLRALAGGRLQYLVLKQGSRGGMVLCAHSGRLVSWWPRTDGVVDPTGAGDAFAAGFLAGLLAGEAVEAALDRGVTGASFAIAGYGPSGLLAATADEAQRRLSRWSGR
jgi:sugar/nucleoside kinase (ribokinase family)